MTNRTTALYVALHAGVGIAAVAYFVSFKRYTQANALWLSGAFALGCVWGLLSRSRP